MKRPVKLAVMAGVLVLLIVGTLLLNAGNERRAEAEKTDFTVFSLDQAGIVEFGWEYGSDLMRFVPSDDKWQYKDDSSFPLDYLKVSQAAEALSEVIAHKGFDPEEELSEYGLEEPEWRIFCSGSDGAETTLSIGDETGLDGYRYFSMGDGMVYLVDSSITDSFSYTLPDLAEQEQLPATLTDTVSMTVSSGGINYRISRVEAEEDEESEEETKSYILDYPSADDETAEALALDSTLAEDFMKTITYNMIWQETASWKASREDLSQFGLDEPAMEVSVVYLSPEKLDTGMLADDGEPIYDTKYNEELFRFLIGKGSDGLYYGRIDGSEMIYRIASSVYETLYSMSPDSLISEL